VIRLSIGNDLVISYKWHGFGQSYGEDTGWVQTLRVPSSLLSLAVIDVGKPITNDPKVFKLGIGSQDHSLYQVWTLWDHLLWVYAADKQTNRQTNKRATHADCQLLLSFTSFSKLHLECNHLNTIQKVTIHARTQTLPPHLVSTVRGICLTDVVKHYYKFFASNTGLSIPHGVNIHHYSIGLRYHR